MPAARWRSRRRLALTAIADVRSAARGKRQRRAPRRAARSAATQSEAGGTADVDVVAFAGTHVGATFTKEGVLFVNPGSPTLPSDGTPSVAVLDGSKQTPKVSLVRF